MADHASITRSFPKSSRAATVSGMFARSMRLTAFLLLCLPALARPETDAAPAEAVPTEATDAAVLPTDAAPVEPAPAESSSSLFDPSTFTLDPSAFAQAPAARVTAPLHSRWGLNTSLGYGGTGGDFGQLLEKPVAGDFNIF